MKTLYEAIEKYGGQQSASLIKHLKASGINDWCDLTKARLCDFRDELCERVCSSSARTYMNSLKPILHRYDEEGIIPCKSYETILRAKAEQVVKTYLTPSELAALEKVPTLSPVETYVKLCFCIGARTGMRVSDTMSIRTENINNGYLTYVSQKTSIAATIPCGERVQVWIREVTENPIKVSISGYNRAIRRLCQRAGINTQVRVFKAGKTQSGPKWKFISSHSARVSVATNLSIVGTQLTDIKSVLGHSSTQMTERYIAPHDIQLNEATLAYLR